MQIRRRRLQTIFLTITLCVSLFACHDKTDSEKDAPMQTNTADNPIVDAFTVSSVIDFPQCFGAKTERLLSSDRSDGKMIVMTNDKTLYFWDGMDGDAETHPRSGSMTRITWREPPDFVFLSRFALCYVDSDGNLWLGKFYSAPVMLAENVIYAEAFLNFGFMLTVEGTLRAWNRDSEMTEIMQDVRAAKSFGAEVFVIKNDDSLWKLVGFDAEGFPSSPNVEWIMDGVRETSGHLILLNDGTVWDLDATHAQTVIHGEVVHINSNGSAHAAVCADGSLYLWGTVFTPGNRQESVVLEAPVLLCDSVSDAVPCYSGTLILKNTGETLVCELDDGKLTISPTVSSACQ